MGVTAGLGGLSFLGGLLPRKTQQTQTQTSSPTYDSTASPVRSLVQQQILSRLQGDQNPALTAGYTGSSLNNINDAYNAAKQNVMNTLTARGLGRSPVVGSAAATLDSGRAGAAGNFLNSLPLLQRQLQTEDLGLGQNFFLTGQGTTGTGAGTSSGGGGLAGGFTNLAGMLGYLQQKGAFGNGSRGTGLPGTPSLNYAYDPTGG